MDKNRILEEAKHIITEYATRLDYETLDLYGKRIRDYLDYLQATKDLLPPPSLDESPVSEDSHEKFESQSSSNDETPVENTPILSEKKEEYGRTPYRFERKLTGGELVGIGAYVPEKLVRELDINHGDLVYAEPIETERQYGLKQYRYELAERKYESEPKERVQMNFCKVKKMEVLDRLYVEDTIYGEEIWFDEVRHPLTINFKDVSKLQLKEGSIVDVAYYTNDPQGTLRVIWNYATEEISTMERPRKSSHYKKTKENTSTESSYDLQNKNILLVGCEPKRSDYKELVEKNGGIFFWVSGREDEERLRAKVRNADLVVMNLAHVGHMGTTRVIDYCKEYNVAHENIYTFGNTGFIRTVNETINEAIS